MKVRVAWATAGAVALLGACSRTCPPGACPPVARAPAPAAVVPAEAVAGEPAGVVAIPASDVRLVSGEEGGALPPPFPATEPLGPAAAQVERGRLAYAANCASCHGPLGRGSEKAPALVGPGALPVDPPAKRWLRKAPFHTAKDVGDFVLANMPPRGQGAKPSTEDAWAIVAYLASANGTHLAGPIDSREAASAPLR